MVQIRRKRIQDATTHHKTNIRGLLDVTHNRASDEMLMLPFIVTLVEQKIHAHVHVQDQKGPGHAHVHGQDQKAPNRSQRLSAVDEVLLARFEKLAFLDYGVEVRSSSIEGGGNGLFATREFKIGDVITEYTGEWILTQDIGENQYGIEDDTEMKDYTLMGYVNLDALSAHGVAQFTNDGCYKEGVYREDDDCRNAEFFTTDDKETKLLGEMKKTDLSVKGIGGGLPKVRVWLSATKDISPGEELFVTYGPRYWGTRSGKSGSRNKKKARKNVGRQSSA